MPSCLLDKFIRSSLTPVDCADVGAAVTTVICFLACKLSNLVLGPNSWTGPTSKTGPGRPLDWANLKLARAARWGLATHWTGPLLGLDRAT